MQRTLAQLLILTTLTTAASGCATARAQDGRVPLQTAPAYVPDLSLMADYVRQLPVGARVRVTLTDGHVLHGTLMKADADPIVVQKRTRIPEAPLPIALKDVQAVELEGKSGNPARTVAIGTAAGVASALGVLLIIAAIFAGSD